MANPSKPDTSSAAPARAVEAQRTASGAVPLKDESSADAPKVEGTVSVFTLDKAALSRALQTQAASKAGASHKSAAPIPLSIVRQVFPHGFRGVTGATYYRTLLSAADGQVSNARLHASVKRDIPSYGAGDAAGPEYRGHMENPAWCAKRGLTPIRKYTGEVWPES